jgi:hypothetical protein
MRDTIKYEELINETEPEIHPIFNLVEGDIKKWEIINRGNDT